MNGLPGTIPSFSVTSRAVTWALCHRRALLPSGKSSRADYQNRRNQMEGFHRGIARSARLFRGQEGGFSRFFMVFGCLGF